MAVITRFRRTVPRLRVGLVLIAMGLVTGVMGCGKVPTWSELTGGQPPAPPPPPPKANPTPVTVEVPAAKPAVAAAAHQEDPGQVLMWFKSQAPLQMNDHALARVAALSSSGLETLTEIDANRSAVTDAGLASLGKLPALKKLVLDGTVVTNQGMKALQNVRSLEHLSLNSTKITAEGLAFLAELPGLKRLEISQCSLTPAEFAAIGKLPALEALVLNRSPDVNDEALDLICEASTLKSLQLNETIGLTDKGLMALAKVPALEELHLNRSQITGVGLGAAISKGGLKRLKLLAISAAPINLAGARAINSLKTLESLDIGFIAGMNDIVFGEFIEGMKNLKTLNVEVSKGLTGPGLVKLKVASNSLETLLLPNSGMTDQGFVHLKGHKKLRFIDLSNTSVTLAGVQQFKRLVPTCDILYAGVRY